MKRVAIAAAVLLLAGCSSPSEKVAGQVVSCESISSSTTKNSLFLDCLDGGVGATIDSIKGPAIINVWGSWCGPCKEEMPILRSFYEKAQGKVLLIGVDVEEASLEDGRKFVENNGITWPNLFDADGKSRAYFGMGVPVTWFIASDGSVAHKHIGVLKNEIDLISLTSKYLGVKL
ncbi:MAG: TlpA family protein disulfide reductase [Actinobacteria bacterium]|jgi:thiol-disulfide isomerase/thioredoxin|nr:TlpA family protein disulfide reductase [Actinomycetota bacterium]NCV82442.1 TlpA family protein disulfide reductase [Actinomycetota bacterium]NCW72328.1 TlpA family protein disulfide reductase [Actinomycetota bacterium]NCW92573.1 TlpA family protein disulfide reductase [Actinomycetota bacterium]NCX37673.1 TlpA family protein disulfide reductase [Actinomycetota bacterium]